MPQKKSAKKPGKEAVKKSAPAKKTVAKTTKKSVPAKKTAPKPALKSNKKTVPAKKTIKKAVPAPVAKSVKSNKKPAVHTAAHKPAVNTHEKHTQPMAKHTKHEEKTINSKQVKKQ